MFVYTIFALVAVLITLCLGLAVLSYSLVISVQNTKEQERRAQVSLELCSKEQMRLDARVEAFEDILITPHMQAVEAAVREYKQAKQAIGGTGDGEATVDDFNEWI